ncbi:class I SAM-dependent methyltransferase [Aestuariibaculum sediminum]|uniref:Methyltransferase domain-containing protein n=1 Tax=Aestuariibaculum sediminum TaxID=2770637 RepID=A0A8J6U6F2_9FLAO|nr:methyltransferase domain-containing protein [Aestuariibaculum sediminum]MBD0830730.1 methyltransferase domain-containing protein [Aestuariibaculum sediminum]
MELKKRIKYQGVLNILSFNRHFYIYGFIVFIITLTTISIFNTPSVYLWCTISLFLYGMVAPLAVSAYVYDYSNYYNFDWLKKYGIEDHNSKLNININAGFDETSFVLKHKYPKSNLIVFDFYNPNNHTEPAIVRARNVSQIYPGTQKINTSKIPLKNKSVDTIFLLSSVHEMRSNNEKINFLKECRRICKPNGKIIMVEHLRDFPNFLAFSIGFTHFFSKQVWKNALKTAGFSTVQETKFTPFLSIFYCSP